MAERNVSPSARVEIKCGLRRMAILENVMESMKMWGISDDIIETILRRAFYNIGLRDAEEMPIQAETMTLRQIMQTIMASPDWHIAKETFDLEVIKMDDDSVKWRVNNCPVHEYSMKRRLSPEKADLICDIANESMFGQFEAMGLSLECPHRLGVGDDHCLYVFSKRGSAKKDNQPPTFEKSWKKRQLSK